MSLKPTESMPAWQASATASYGFFSCGDAFLGRHAAMKPASDAALSGLPAVLAGTMLPEVGSYAGVVAEECRRQWNQPMAGVRENSDKLWKCRRMSVAQASSLQVQPWR